MADSPPIPAAHAGDAQAVETDDGAENPKRSQALDAGASAGSPVLDDFSISLLRKMFELLDHWDRQPSGLKPM